MQQSEINLEYCFFSFFFNKNYFPTWHIIYMPYVFTYHIHLLLSCFTHCKAAFWFVVLIHQNVNFPFSKRAYWHIHTVLKTTNSRDRSLGLIQPNHPFPSFLIWIQWRMVYSTGLDQQEKGPSYSGDVLANRIGLFAYMFKTLVSYSKALVMRYCLKTSREYKDYYIVSKTLCMKI